MLTMQALLASPWGRARSAAAALAPAGRRLCVACGAPFDPPQRLGRPPSTCGEDACARARRAASQRDYYLRHLEKRRQRHRELRARKQSDPAARERLRRDSREYQRRRTGMPAERAAELDVWREVALAVAQALLEARA